MPSELEATRSKLDNAVEGALEHAISIVTKNYLDKLETYEIMDPSEEDIDIDIAECGKFYKLSKLVLNKEENFLNKLTTIVNVISGIECSLATIIRSDGYQIDYYLGIVTKKARDWKETSVKRRKADAKAFKGALLGNLVGSELEEISKVEMQGFRENILMSPNNCYSSVSGIVALRDKDKKSIEDYVQGMENLVDSLNGQKYTIIMMADPVNASELQVIRQGYELLHTQLSTFSRSMVTINESDNLSLSTAKTDSISKGIAQGISMTQNRTTSTGKYFGASINAGVSFVVSANAGINAGVSNGSSMQTGRTQSQQETRQWGEAATKTTASSKSSGKSLQLQYDNRSVKSLLDKIDKQLERLDECESFGAFDCATYVITEERETALTVASNYNALMRGENSNVQASHINLWYKKEETKILRKYLGSLVHPRFLESKDSGIIVSPASIVSGNEIAIQIGLPKKSVTGITVIPMAPFGRNILCRSENVLTLGNLYHMGHDEGENRNKQKVNLEIESLTMHTFITGSTGAGKSTTIFGMLGKLMDQGIKFLVVEPAKGEYKDRFGNYNNVKVYGTNYKKTPLLKINPFSFPDDILVLEHIERLIEIFNVCWPMYAAMPAVLKDAIERAYVIAGWDLETSECRYKANNGKPLFPTFMDVLNQINVVMETSQYSADSKGDYKGALCTRVKSLTNGLYSQIFTCNELPEQSLFDENVIIDLSRVGSSETRSLIMGLLVMKLQEYRMANTKMNNVPLKHVTVLEEAHHILKKTSLDQSHEGAQLMGKSVEMLAQSIAEMRTYGEGFIIADQAPGLMDPSVIRNTNTKIILRLPDFEDRKLVGQAASLNEEQILELSRLKTFVAAVYQNDWLEPVLCHIDTQFKQIERYQYEKIKEETLDKQPFIEYLLLPLDERKKLDTHYVELLRQKVYGLPISTEAKVAFMKYMNATNKDDIQKFRGQVIYALFNAEVAFGLAKQDQEDIASWYEHMKSVLEPAITIFNELDQKKIIAILTKEKVRIDEAKESVALFERLMEYV